MAQLGHKAYTAMANGEAVDDGVLVDIFIEEVRALPEGSGWILDNFPTTLSQAKVCVCAGKGLDYRLDVCFDLRT